jgi:hypothetical protein
MSCSIVWGKGLAEKLGRFVYIFNGGRLVTCGAAAGGQPNDDITAIVSTKDFKICGSTLGGRKLLNL